MISISRNTLRYRFNLEPEPAGNDSQICRSKNLLVFFLFLASLVGCASSPYIAEKDDWSLDMEDDSYSYSSPYMENHSDVVTISMKDLKGFLMEYQPIEVSELLNNAELLQRVNLDIQINHMTAKVVEIEGGKYFVRAFDLGMSNAENISIQSFVIPAQYGPDYIFYPALTVYDADQKKISEIKPEFNGSVNGGILKLDFSIPTNAKYLVVHTNQDYLKYGAVSGEEGGISHSMGYANTHSPELGAAYGGLIGGLIFAAIDSDTKSQHDFYFAHGGIIAIEVSDSQNN